MNKLVWLGALLITIGSFTFVYYFIDWYDARKTVEALTSTEIQQYKNIQPVTNDKKMSKMNQTKNNHNIVYQIKNLILQILVNHYQNHQNRFQLLKFNIKWENKLPTW